MRTPLLPAARPPCAACRYRLAQRPARQPQSAVPRSPPSVTHVNELLLILPSHRGQKAESTYDRIHTYVHRVHSMLKAQIQAISILSQACYEYEPRYMHRYQVWGPKALSPPWWQNIVALDLASKRSVEAPACSLEGNNVNENYFSHLFYKLRNLQKWIHIRQFLSYFMN